MLNRVEINGSVGSVSIDAIGDIIAVGDIIGPIEATGDHTNPTITKLQCTGTGSSILGDVTSAGLIKWIVAENGDVGQATSPISINCTYIFGFVKGKNVYADVIATSGDISSIEATAGEIVGDFSAVNIKNPNGNKGIIANGNINLQLTLSDAIRDNFIITGGDFTANSSINAWGIRDGGDFSVLRSGSVGGYFKGDIVFTGNLSSGSVFQIDESLEGTINIGQSLLDTVTIDGFSNSGEGLTGQIIVNSNNASGVWDELSVVTVGGTPLSPIPYYNNKSDDLGGGAVGLARYYCHYKDCTPRGTKVDEDASTGFEQLTECGVGYHAQLRIGPGQLSATVTIRHYGPVMQDGTGKPFTVRSKPVATAPCENNIPNWVDVTSSFTHAFPITDRRAIKITGPFADAYDYLIEPKTSGAVRLVCDDLSTPNTVPVKDYGFRVRVFYLQNLNMTGGLEPGDIATWLLEPADTTLDGTTDGDDLIDVIDAVAEYGE